MTFRIAILGGLLAALTSLPLAVNAFDKDKDKPRAKVFQTPQEAFDAYVAAEQKDDYKAMLRVMAPQAQKEAAAMLGIVFGAERMALEEAKDKEKDKAKVTNARLRAFELIFAVMESHDLTTKVLAEVKNSKDPKEREKSKKAILAAVKDPERFAAEMLTALARLPRGQKPTSKVELGKDLKIDGDNARGTLVRTLKDSKETVTREPVEFVKIDGGWRIVPAMDFDRSEKSKDKD